MKQLYSVFFLVSAIQADNLTVRHPEVSPLQIARNAPETFGKTHFIVGEPIQEVHQDPVKKSEPSYTTNQIFFAPDDNLQAELVRFINDEQKKIRAAIFLFTDSEIAHALVAAKKRGVQVELVTDTSCIREKHNKIGTLCDCGCMLFVYNPSYAKKDSGSIMHHKFMVFDKNKNDKSLVWTGSFNFTKSASRVNQENAVVLDDPKVVQKFVNQFDRLKERAYRYGMSTKIG